MDILQRGRQDILDEVNKAFDRIGAGLTIELDPANSILIHRGKLRDLRDRAAKADTLEDEVSSLVRQKRAQDARLGELERVRGTNAENELLNGENARLKEELEMHKAAASRVEELERENKRLAEQVRQSLDLVRDVSTPARFMSGNLPVSSEPPSSISRIEDDGYGTVSRTEWLKLVRKFNTLYENHKDMSSVRETLQQTLRDRNDENKRWKELFDALEVKNKEKNARIRELNVELQKLRAQVQDVKNGNTADQLPMLFSGGDNGSDEMGGETEFEAWAPSHTSSTNDALLPISPSKPDAPEIKQEHSIETPLSPNTPVVVSSRSIRKRKDRGGTIQTNDTPTVKIETITSSPLGLAALYNLEESIDLDDIGEKQSTPRKGRSSEQGLRIRLGKAGPIESQSQDQSHSSGSGSTWEVTPTHRAGASRKISALQPCSANKQILPRTSVDRPTKKRRIVSPRDVSSLLEDGQLTQSVEKSPPKKNTPTPQQDRILGNLLDKESPPRVVLRSPARLTPILPKSRPSAAGAPTLSSRAYEVHRDPTPDSATFHPPLTKANGRDRDSANSSRPVSRESVQKSTESSRPSSKGSIRDAGEPTRPPSKEKFIDSSYFSRPTSRDSTMERPEPPISSKQTHSTSAEPPRPSSRHSLRGSVEAERPSLKDWNFQLKTPATAPTSIKRVPKEQNATPSRNRKQPLRTRPLDGLTFQDFKVNPNYTGGGGYGYAYNDVVRKQAERRCLQGCTKPDCCGAQFRALAEATRNPDQSLTLSQQEADEKTLEEFLGDNAYKLRNMTKAERQETLMVALTRDMANKHGRHRHAFEGRTTPPGRWRADFPSTQEEIQDREEAQRLNREEVRKRYEAAMRPGGAYMFRDE